MKTTRKQFLKQAALLGIGSTFLNRNLFAANGNDTFSCTLDCSYDLYNNNYPGIGDDIQTLEDANAIIYGKSGTLYKDENFTSDCPPSSVLCDSTSYSANLKYHVYYPNLSASTYASCPLPAFIFAHAGGFSDCSNLTSNPLDPGRIICIEMAKRGYVSFSIEYRRGRTLTSGAVSAQQLLAYYRGCQDYRGAIRSILKRQAAFPGEHTFQIDVKNVFLGGTSAGSFAALNAAYIQSQSMMEAFMSPNITTAMGDLNINLYYGGSSINYLPSIKGVLNCWGNLYISPDPTIVADIPRYFLNNDTSFPPIISFQGLNDTVAAPDKRPGVFPSGTTPGGARTDNCLTNTGSVSSYTLPVTNAPSSADVLACGAKELYRILTDSRINKPTELYLDSSMGHGIMDSDDDFGTGYPMSSDVYKYIAHRAATFFQAVRTGIAPGIGDNVFTDCANYRAGCTTGYTNSCSTNHL